MTTSTFVDSSEALPQAASDGRLGSTKRVTLRSDSAHRPVSANPDEGDSRNGTLVELAEDANADLLDYMMLVLEDGRTEAAALYRRLRVTYWLLISLAVALFVFGVLLLVSPLWLPMLVAPRNGTSFDWFALFFPPALGIADLLSLYLYNPMQRINRLMSAMTQLTVILNQHHVRTALRLVECRISVRSTVGAAADHVETVAGYTLRAIDDHFNRAASADGGTV
jgi:hypothetical protein